MVSAPHWYTPTQTATASSGHLHIRVADSPYTDDVVGVAGVEDGTVGRPGNGDALGLGFHALGDLRGQGCNQGLVLQVIHTDTALGSGAQPVPVGGEADLVHGLLTVQLIQVLATGKVPQLGLTVFAGGSAQGTIRGDGDAVHVTGVALQGVQALEGG
eukprot:Tbor_TRINITY_DN3568_c0_g1::TRINITY_DN3568_c0_g1_i1::g.2961::m.2961